MPEDPNAKQVRQFIVQKTEKSVNYKTNKVEQAHQCRVQRIINELSTRNKDNYQSYIFTHTYKQLNTRTELPSQQQFVIIEKVSLRSHLLLPKSLQRIFHFMFKSN